MKKMVIEYYVSVISHKIHTNILQPEINYILIVIQQAEGFHA